MIGLIIQREYEQRVRRKSFIITTLLIPFVMILLMVLPTLVMLWQSPEHLVVNVVDNTGRIAQGLRSGDEVTYIVQGPMAQAATDSLAADEASVVLVIGENAIADPTAVTLLAHTAVAIETSNQMSRELSDIIEDLRLGDDPELQGADVAQLRQAIERAQADVEITTVRLDRSEEESASATLSVGIGMLMTFILYMVLLMYGQLVMNSIIEEKNNRVLELVVSSTSPTQLMLGKIIGVGLVALTQILIWAVLIGSVATFVMPMLIGQLAQGVDASSATMLAPLASVGYVMGLFGYMTLFLVGGFLLYASIFAAVGSAVDNVQDASQLTSVAVLPILVALVIAMSAAANPNSPLAFWCSLIPLTSPMVMMARIPAGIAGWEIWVSLLVLYASFLGLVWVAAKIYRVGIFTYGKKPTLKDLVRWARYK